MMKLLITDAPASDVRIALGKEHHDRTEAFHRLCYAGHVRVVNDDNPATITCKVEDETFSEERTRFPTTQLMARLQLAIAAGRSCRNGVGGVDQETGAYPMEPSFIAIDELQHWEWDNNEVTFIAIDELQHWEWDNNEVTAAVKSKSKALRGGFRP